MEPVPAPVEEDAPISVPQDLAVEQHPVDVKDDEEPMEQEESNPVIEVESEPVPQVVLT